MKVEIYEKGSSGPIIFWLMFPFKEGEAEHLMECLDEIMPVRQYALVCCEVSDWNSELSPWKAKAVMGDEDFEGCGEETLRRLQEKCVPEVLSSLGSERKTILAGYSLAGLFALWAAYETDIFDGYVCCSGSLWYNGWDEYVKAHGIRSECSIYLSLGGKEEKTDNAVMAGIGSATRAQEKILKADPKVRKVILEMNSGGHFADSGKRLAKGIKWMAETGIDDQ